MRVRVSSTLSDQAFGLRLARELRRHGMTVSTAVDLRPDGEDPSLRLRENLDSADCFVCILSQTSLLESGAALELGFAISRAKEVKLRIVGVTWTDEILPASLDHIQVLDARTLSIEEIAVAIGQATNGHAPPGQPPDIRSIGAPDRLGHGDNLPAAASTE